jgi:hypothetical protein
MKIIRLFLIMCFSTFFNTQLSHEKDPLPLQSPKPNYNKELEQLRHRAIQKYLENDNL